MTSAFKRRISLLLPLSLHLNHSLALLQHVLALILSLPDGIFSVMNPDLPSLDARSPGRKKSKFLSAPEFCSLRSVVYRKT